MRSLVMLLLLALALTTMALPLTPRYALVLHGGAGADPARMAPEEIEASLEGLRAALDLGRRMLREGAGSLETVEQVVRSLEDCPAFNAGKGAVFNSQGQHELDAAIMDGRTRACGAVAGVRTVKNPVSLARLVMLKTPHVLLMGEGADSFAVEMEVERVDNSYFSTPRREKSRGTVGCVALDSQGHLAAATSTGGLSNKQWGRVGDTPIVGAGTYADDRTCAVSCTGVGEEFIRRAIAHDVAARMAYAGLALPAAAEEALASLPPDTGGLIAVDRKGSLVTLFNTPGMAWGQADSTGAFKVGLKAVE